MLGNEAIARGAYEAGVTVATAYPGTPSTEIVSKIADYPEIYAEWSPNEKVALEVGIGASLGGARTLVAMKHVGVNVAADPLLTFAYAGVNAGLVLVSADDPGLHSSQNEQDNRRYGVFAKIPVIEPTDSMEAKRYVKLGFDISEQFDIPVMLRLTTRISHSSSLVEEEERQNVDLKDYVKNPQKNLMLPAVSMARHISLEERIQSLKEFAETTDINCIEWGTKDIGIICNGVSYQYIKEILPQVSILKLGMTNPLPEKMIRYFAGEVDRLIVVEELDPIIEDQIKSWGLPVEGKSILPLVGEYSPDLISERLLGQISAKQSLNVQLPGRPPLMCPGCPHRGVFYTLNQMKLNVMGDIGCYTLGGIAPLNAMDGNLCMGASIGMTHGMEKARGTQSARKTVAVIGDSTFVHSGITALIDIVYNKGTSTILILDNDTTAMTGHQDHPATGVTIKNEPTYKLDLEAMVRAAGINNISIVDPLNLEEVRETIERELNRREPSVIITRRPCALLEKKIPVEKHIIDNDLCTGCKRCIKLGCMGIRYLEKEKKAIFSADCVSCGLCAQVCKFDAVKLSE
jgi:indolepyruvate ferredoxin oxidoreductase alpha subunit